MWVIELRGPNDRGWYAGWREAYREAITYQEVNAPRWLTKQDAEFVVTRLMPVKGAKWRATQYSYLVQT